MERVPSELRPTDSVTNEGTSSMNINTPQGTGASAVPKVIPGAELISNTQSGTLTQTDAIINRNEQVPPVSMQSTNDPLQEPQRPIKLEPEPVVSRQPIIQTQPAVDFMSSFLSQPIDPTRRENRQQTVDITSNIDNTQVETARSVAPSQTLVQDAKSQDWNTFISSFLMGSAGFDQFGGQSSGPMEGPNPNQGSGSIAPLQESQSSNQKFAEFSPEPIVSIEQGSPSVQTSSPSLEQVNILPLENTGGSGYAPDSQLNTHNVRPDVVTYKENANPTEGSQVVSDANLTNNPLVSGTDIPFVSKPVNTIDDSQAGRNTGYQVSMSSPNEMGNVIGFTGTRPLDTPQTAEITSVDTKITSAEPFKTAESNLALGLSDQPLTSFEGATASDLQKLKLLEVAQRLLLQERGIKDPQADSQIQTFTPQGMPGSIDNLLATLNQANSLADMIKKSLVQGQSIQTTVMPDTTTTSPPRNIKLGEWSSGVAAGGGVPNERSSGVPIGNIFAGRFLQNGIGLPSVSGSPDTLSLDLSGGIPIGQSNVVDKPVDTSTSGAGGFSIVDKLAQPYQQECKAVKDPTSKFHFYRLVGAGRVRFRCALGTAFDEQTCQCSIIVMTHGKTSADPEGGGTGGPDPLENYKNSGFLSNTGPGSLKITKIPSQHSMLGHHLPASETPFKWRFAGGP